MWKNAGVAIVPPDPAAPARLPTEAAAALATRLPWKPVVPPGTGEPSLTRFHCSTPEPKSLTGWPGAIAGRPAISSQNPESQIATNTAGPPRSWRTESTSCHASTIRALPARSCHCSGLRGYAAVTPSCGFSSGIANGCPTILSPTRRPRARCRAQAAATSAPNSDPTSTSSPRRRLSPSTSLAAWTSTPGGRSKRTVTTRGTSSRSSSRRGSRPSGGGGRSCSGIGVPPSPTRSSRTSRSRSSTTISFVTKYHGAPSPQRTPASGRPAGRDRQAARRVRAEDSSMRRPAIPPSSYNHAGRVTGGEDAEHDMRMKLP